MERPDLEIMRLILIMWTNIRTVIKIHREGFYVHNRSESSKHPGRGIRTAFSETRKGGSGRLGPTAKK